MRATDVLMAFPEIVLAARWSACSGPKPWLIVLTVTVSHAPAARPGDPGGPQQVAERDYVKAAEAVSGAPTRIMFARDPAQRDQPAHGRGRSAADLLDRDHRRDSTSSASACQPPNPDWGIMINENRLGVRPTVGRRRARRSRSPC